MTISSGAECCSYDDQDQLCRDSLLLHFDVGHGCQPVYLSIFNVFSVILNPALYLIIYNVSTDACIRSIMSRVFTVFLLLYIYMSFIAASFICHLVSACTGVRCRIYVLITAIGYLRRCSEDCRDREITPPMIHRFAAN